MRTCMGCGETKPASAFAKHDVGTDGLRARCRDCAATYYAKWYDANKAKVSVQHRAKRRADPEKAKAYGRVRYAKNPEKQRALSSAWARVHPMEVRANCMRKVARQLGAPGDGIAPDQLRDLLAASLGLCAYCNGRPKELCLDHIEPLSRGGMHDVENVTVVCRGCNASKYDTPLLVWLACGRKGLPDRGPGRRRLVRAA